MYYQQLKKEAIMARIITVNAQGQIESVAHVTVKRLQIFLVEVTVAYIDMFGRLVTQTYVEFRIFKKEIHLDIEQAMLLVDHYPQFQLH